MIKNNSILFDSLSTLQKFGAAGLLFIACSVSIKLFHMSPRKKLVLPKHSAENNYHGKKTKNAHTTIVLYSEHLQCLLVIYVIVTSVFIRLHGFINGRIGRLSPFTRDNQMFQMYENAWIQISYEGELPIQRQRSGLLRTEPDGREIHQLDPSEESNSLTAQVPAPLTPALRSSNEARNEQRNRLHNNSNFFPPQFQNNTWWRFTRK